MIGGIEALWSWTQPGGSEPAIEINRIKADDGTPVWPRYKLTRVSGIGSTGDPEDVRDRPPGAAREITRSSVRRGKTVVLEGLIQARSLVELREAEAELRAAFDDIEGEGRFDVFWHPLLAAFAGVPPKFLEARALSCDVIDSQETRNFERPFVIGVRMSDRRYFDEESEVHTVELKETNTGTSF